MFKNVKNKFTKKYIYLKNYIFNKKIQLNNKNIKSKYNYNFKIWFFNLF